MTTEIFSGRKDVNPYKLKHYSESADDRTLVRFVHEAPRDIDMGPTSESWKNLQLMQWRKFSTRRSSTNIMSLGAGKSRRRISM